LSLDSNRQKLDELFLVTEPDLQSARIAASLQTNCATTMRAIYAIAGCNHPLVTCPIRIGMALSWVLQAARDKCAVVQASRWYEVGPGWGLHYASAGRNDDHVDWCVSTPSATGVATRIGGGKPRNAIEYSGPGDIRWSVGRPLVALIDPVRMLVSQPRTEQLTVRGIQQALCDLGYGPLAIDGIAGPKTTDAIKGFQRDFGLVCDGIVGPITRSAISRAIESAAP